MSARHDGRTGTISHATTSSVMKLGAAIMHTVPLQRRFRFNLEQQLNIRRGFQFVAMVVGTSLVLYAPLPLPVSLGALTVQVNPVWANQPSSTPSSRRLCTNPSRFPSRDRTGARPSRLKVSLPVSLPSRHSVPENNVGVGAS